MLLRILYLLPLCLATQMALADHPGRGYEQEQDPVPNWESADYACPRMIISKGGKHNFTHAELYEYSLRYGKWNYRVPGAREHVDHDFDPSKEQAYLFCRYQSLTADFIVAAKKATHCSFLKGLCWKGNPYDFRTPPSSTFYGNKLPEEELPNGKAIKYACPLGIKIKTGVHKFLGYEVYQYSSDGDWVQISKGDLIKADNVFVPPKQKSYGAKQYAICHYEGTTVEIMMETSPQD